MCNRQCNDMINESLNNTVDIGLYVQLCIEYHFSFTFIPPAISLFDSPHRNATFYDLRLSLLLSEEASATHQTNVYNILYKNIP